MNRRLQVLLLPMLVLLGSVQPAFAGTRPRPAMNTHATARVLDEMTAYGKTARALVADLGLSRHTVSKSIRILRDLGAIEVKAEKGPHGARQYALTWDAMYSHEALNTAVRSLPQTTLKGAPKALARLWKEAGPLAATTISGKPKSPFREHADALGSGYGPGQFNHAAKALVESYISGEEPSGEPVTRPVVARKILRLFAAEVADRAKDPAEPSTSAQSKTGGYNTLTGRLYAGNDKRIRALAETFVQAFEKRILNAGLMQHALDSSAASSRERWSVDGSDSDRLSERPDAITDEVLDALRQRFPRQLGREPTVGKMESFLDGIAKTIEGDAKRALRQRARK